MLFGLLSKQDINKGVENWKATHGAVLLDVRTKEEYEDYHIDGSLNIPLQNLALINKRLPDKNTPIFVHCLSGVRSESATAMLKNAGYSQVINIGGIRSYKGPTV